MNLSEKKIERVINILIHKLTVGESCTENKTRSLNQSLLRFVLRNCVFLSCYYFEKIENYICYSFK